MEEEDISIEDLHADLAQKHSALARLYADVCAERDLLLSRVAALEETEAGVKRVRRAGGGDDASDEAANSLDEDEDNVQALDDAMAVPVTSEDLVLFEVRFSEQVMQHLSRLFELLDTQKQGFITQASFTSGVGPEYFENLGTWEEIKLYFDADGNDAIDPEEFVSGYARIALSKAVQTPADQAMLLTEFAGFIQNLVEHYATEEIMAHAQKLSAHLGGRAGEHVTRQSSGITNPDSAVYRARFSDAVLQSMNGIWTALLAGSSEEESVTPESFRSAVGGLGKWENILQMFDEDLSGTIEQKEFLNGFKNWLLQTPIPIPAGEGRLEEILRAVDEAANAHLLTKLSEFKASLSQ
jgi:hypothetical protein